MKKILLTTAMVLFAFSLLNAQEVQYKGGVLFPTPEEDSVLTGLSSFRSVTAYENPFEDGKNVLLAVNYLDNGHAHMFVNAGDDSLELVWTSPDIVEEGGNSTPRMAKLSDMDGDGDWEIIFHSRGNGFLLYEWDGVPGSYNFGDAPAQFIQVFPSMGGNEGVEYFEVDDIDLDGKQELVTAFNTGTSSGDGFFIIEANGQWLPGSPGFSSFTIEFQALRPDFPEYGLGGSPYVFVPAQFDGEGTKEAIIHNWNFKNVTPLRTTGEDTYEMADPNSEFKNLQLTPDGDGVTLTGAFAFDIDEDGREEVYLPSYNVSYGIVHMIYYDEGADLSMIDSSNVFELDLTVDKFGEELATGAVFGGGYGDYDGDGKPNLYFSGSYGHHLVTAEFQGGDKTDPANWEAELLAYGDSLTIETMTIKDSAGVVDTTTSVPATYFAAQMWGRYTDFDDDGQEDMFLPIQVVNDSIAVTELVWNGADYDTTESKVVNPNRYNPRMYEYTGAVGVEAKDITVIVPDDYKLEQNYPNPFNPTTTIRFSLPLNKAISLKVYDILGKEVKTLINNQEFNAGSYEVTWDGTNNFGSQAASGNYIYTLQYGNFQKSMKMTLLK